MTVSFDGPGADEPRQRLMAGEYTEVFVIGRRLHKYLPQALGLESLRQEDFLFTPSRKRRTSHRLRNVALKLAAGKGWVAEGEVFHTTPNDSWVDPFMDRAQVIIDIRLHRRFTWKEIDLSVIASVLRGRWADPLRRLTRRRSGDRLEPGPELSLYLAASPSNPTSHITLRGRVTPAARTAAYAAEYHPGKLVTITTRAQLRQLRKVRPRLPE